MPPVQVATADDFLAWLRLAEEVEALFGPLVTLVSAMGAETREDIVQEAGFLAALANNLQRGSAFCIRQEDGPPGSPLLGGLLFSAKPPAYRISWLAVAARARKQGYGARLLGHALDQVTPPATVSVVTFGSDNAAGLPARRLYESFGFIAEEMTDPGPEGGSRQIFRLHRDGPTW